MTDKKISLKAIKIGLLGDSTVGKTAICNSFFNMEFNQDMLSTIGSDKLETKYTLKVSFSGIKSLKSSSRHNSCLRCY